MQVAKAKFIQLIVDMSIVVSSQVVSLTGVF